MSAMTGKERIARILKREPVDRVGLYECPWSDTVKKWRKEGHLGETESPAQRFHYDLANCAAMKMVADLDWQDEIVEEDEDTQLIRNGNGALLRRHKKHDSTPEHVDFAVKERKDWEERIKPLLVPSERRLNIETYRNALAAARQEETFLFSAGINVFELMHPICGHEYMLMGMAADPDWVRDMVDTYSGLIINLMEILFEKGGLPDGVWFYEDMGFKHRPFMSPEMYREIVFPGHKRTIDFCHSLGLPVVMHSCGYVEPLLPGMIEAGIDCLQAMEVKAGMDLPRLKKNFGHKIAFCGGMDVRPMADNDLDGVRRELETKLPTAMKGSGYILMSDHSIPPTCEFATYRYFVEEGLRMGTYRSGA